MQLQDIAQFVILTVPVGPVMAILTCTMDRLLATHMAGVVTTHTVTLLRFNVIMVHANTIIRTVHLMVMKSIINVHWV